MKCSVSCAICLCNMRRQSTRVGICLASVPAAWIAIQASAGFQALGRMATISWSFPYWYRRIPNPSLSDRSIFQFRRIRKGSGVGDPFFLPGLWKSGSRHHKADPDFWPLEMTATLFTPGAAMVQPFILRGGETFGMDPRHGPKMHLSSQAPGMELFSTYMGFITRRLLPAPPSAAQSSPSRTAGISNTFPHRAIYP